MAKKRTLNKWYFTLTYKRGKKKYLDECYKRLYNYVNSKHQIKYNKLKKEYD